MWPAFTPPHIDQGRLDHNGIYRLSEKQNSRCGELGRDRARRWRCRSLAARQLGSDYVYTCSALARSGKVFTLCGAQSSSISIHVVQLRPSAQYVLSCQLALLRPPLLHFGLPTVLYPWKHTGFQPRQFVRRVMPVQRTPTQYTTGAGLGIYQTKAPHCLAARSLVLEINAYLFYPQNQPRGGHRSCTEYSTWDMFHVGLQPNTLDSMAGLRGLHSRTIGETCISGQCCQPPSFRGAL